MADFRTHITTSTACGVGYAVAGYFVWGMPLPACALAGGLCSVSGMLPDIDSDSGVPQRESIAFAAAVVPMLAIDRLTQLGLPPETITLIGAGLYLFIRFAVGWLIKVFTVHRGMWHSIPACAMAGLLAYILASGPELVRLFKAGAVVTGFMSHLLLDEMWSIEFYWGIPRTKKSFGTAMKFLGDSTWGNFATYGVLAALSTIAIGDPMLMKHFDVKLPENSPVQHIANQLHEGAKQQGETLQR